MLTPADMPMGYVLVISTPDRVRIEDANDPKLFIDGGIDATGAVLFDIRAEHEDGTRGGVSGKVLFGFLVRHFGAALIAIRGFWTDGPNLVAFNRLTALGWSQHDAAGGTWTGERANDHGFTVAVCEVAIGSTGYFGWVEARFTR